MDAHRGQSRDGDLHCDFHGYKIVKGRYFRYKGNKRRVRTLK